MALSLGRLVGHGFPGQRSPSDLLGAGRRYETPWQAESSSPAGVSALTLRQMIYLSLR